MGIRKNYGSIVVVPNNNNNNINNCQDLNGKMLPLFVNNNINNATSERKGNNHIFSVNRRELYFLLYCCGYIVYLFFGASLFCYLETPGEIELKISLQQTKRLFYMKYPNVRGELNNLIKFN